MGSAPKPDDIDFDAWVEQAEESLLDDDCEAALAAVEAALALRPENLGALSTKALALSGLDRFDQAVETFSFVIARIPGSPVGYIGRAGVLLQLYKTPGASGRSPSRVEMASADFDAALRLSSDKFERETIQFLRGQFLTEIGAFPDAAEAFEDAAKLEPGSGEDLLHLANARYLAGDGEGGDAASRKLIEPMEKRTKRGGRLTPPQAPRRPRPSRA